MKPMKPIGLKYRRWRHNMTGEIVSAIWLHVGDDRSSDVVEVMDGHGGARHILARDFVTFWTRARALSAPRAPTNFVDMTGQRWGSLVVLRRDQGERGMFRADGKPRARLHVYWVCRCEVEVRPGVLCGAETSVTRSDLVSGRTTTCGRRERHGRRITAPAVVQVAA